MSRIFDLDIPQPSTLSPKARHARDWIAAFTCWDLDAIYSLTTTLPDLAYMYLPASAGIAPKSMKEWHLYNTQMKAMLPDFSVDILHLYESTSDSGAVIAHIHGHATSRTGAPFSQEYIMIIHVRSELFPDTGKSSLKVYRVYEYVDTRFAGSFFSEERKRWLAMRAQLRREEGVEPGGKGGHNNAPSPVAARAML